MAEGLSFSDLDGPMDAVEWDEAMRRANFDVSWHAEQRRMMPFARRSLNAFTRAQRRVQAALAAERYRIRMSNSNLAPAYNRHYFKGPPDPYNRRR